MVSLFAPPNLDEHWSFSILVPYDDEMGTLREETWTFDFYYMKIAEGLTVRILKARKNH